MSQIELKGKRFKVSIPSEKIQQIVSEVAEKMNNDYTEKDIPLFVSILNGSFMFTADLFKNINFNCEVTFLKLASYVGTTTTGDVKQLIGINENIKGRHIIIVEDIVDTGITLEKILELIKKFEPASIKIATFLFKPEAYIKNQKIDYIGLEIPNEFIVGYGLDYDGLGRNLADIYTLSE